MEKKRFRPSEQLRPRVQEQRAEFVRTLARIDPDCLVFIDESGCNLAMSPLYGRALVGERVHDHKPANWGKNLSVIGAVRRDCVLCHQTVEGAVNGPKFIEFVEKRLVPRLGKGDVVVMDNLRPHHAPRVRELIEERGAELIFLPPYSPDFSPIEPCWSFIKHHLRRLKERTVDALRRSIRNTFHRVTTRHLEHWFSHCGYGQCERSPV